MDIVETYNLPIYTQLIIDMKNCNQNDKQTILAHCLAVLEKQVEIIDSIKTNKIDNKIFSDKFIETCKKYLESINISDIYTYALYHDCGKPYCEKDKKEKFPNHEIVSYEKFLEYNNNEFIANLIKNDMVLHRSSSIELNNLVSRTI